MKDEHVSRAPWSLQPSLKEKADEAGVNFDKFIEGLKYNKSDNEMAEELGTSSKVIKNLRHHFEKYGVQSIVGQD